MAVLDDYLTPQQRHVEQLSLGGSTPPPPPVATQVVDRQAYWQEQRQMQEEQQARRREARAQAEEFRRKLAEARDRTFAPFAPALAAMAPIQRLRAQAAQEEAYRSVNVADYGSEAEAIAEAKRRSARFPDVQVRYPGQEQTVGQGFSEFAGQAKQAWDASPLSAEIPGAKRVAETVGNVARPTLEAANKLNPLTAGLQYAGERLPHVPTPSGIQAGFLESAIPTEVWMAALELVPGIGTVPGVKSAVADAAFMVGGRKALAAMLAEEGLPATKAGVAELVKRRGVSTIKSVLEALNSEKGQFDPALLKTSIMERIRRNKPVRLQQEEVRSVERARRSGNVESILAAHLTPDEQIAHLNAARKGALTHAEFETFSFPTDEKRWMIDTIANHPGWQGKGLTKGSAVDAIARVENGYGLRAFEEKLWTEAFGPEFVQAVKERGTNDILANIARAWKTPGVDPMHPQEVIPVGARYSTEAVQQGVDASVRRALQVAQARRIRLTAKELADLRKAIEQAYEVPRSLGPTEAAVAPLGTKATTEAVQSKVDTAIRNTIESHERGGRGAYGIAQPKSLESNLENAMATPASLGPTERTRVIQPFANATERAADDAVQHAIDAAALEHQLQKGAQPEWHYRQQIEAAEQRAASAMNDADPLKSFGQIWRDRALTPFQLWRSWKTSFDNSFLGRQGWKLIASNTREWVGAMKRSYQAMWSPELAARVDAEVRGFSTFELGQRLKRPLAVLSKQRRPEEFLASTEKIPLLNRFERAYTASANYLRQASFERDVRTWIKHNNNAPMPDAIAQRFADNINNATLYGNVAKLEKLSESSSLLGQTFFSLRAKASLPQFIMDTARVMRSGVDPTTRRIIATRFAGWLTLNMSLLYAAKWAGSQTGALDVDANPFSPTFGKIKMGPQTFDIWQGYAPLVRAVVGIGASASGNSDRIGGANPSEIGARYVRNQFSPAAGVLYDFSFGGGKDYRGRDLYDMDELKKYGLDQVTPLFFGDVWAAWSENGMIGLATAAPAAWSGVGTQAYSPSEGAQKRAAKSAVEKPIEDAGFLKVAPEEFHNRAAALNAAFPGADMSKFDTLDDFRKQYVEDFAPEIAKEKGISLRSAEVLATKEVDDNPEVVKLKKDIADWQDNFWRAHKDWAQQAWDAKLDYGPRADIRKELGIK